MSTTSPPVLSFPRTTFAKLSPHAYLLAHLRSANSDTPSRANGRSPTQFRPAHVNNGSLTHAEGSAVVRIGDTTVVCGIRGEILLASNVAGFRADRAISTSSNGLFNEAKELDLLVPNIELATGCSPAFMPGQAPSTLAQSLSMRVYSLLHSSRMIDGEDLRIWYQPPDLRSEDAMKEDDEVGNVVPEIKAFWTLYIDILFISFDGNPFDAAWAAVVSALKDVRLPKAYWDADREMVFCEDSLELSNKLSIRGLPIAVTALVFREKEQRTSEDNKFWILVDPNTFEESLCDESITIVVDCSSGMTKMLGISKTGGTSVGVAEMREIANLAKGRWKEIGSLLGG